jgi:4-amino-4-deoxy-L-arabinose transferase-like glycosyltransferase
LPAFLAVTLFALEPTVLAHGRVVQTDIPASFGFLLFCFMLRRYSRDQSIKRAAWLGFAAGLAILAKFSMLLVGPIVVGYFAMRIWQLSRQRESWTGPLIDCATAAAVSILTINAVYFFRHRRLESWDVQWIQDTFPPIAAGYAIEPVAYLLRQILCSASCVSFGITAWVIRPGCSECIAAQVGGITFPLPSLFDNHSFLLS